MMTYCNLFQKWKVGSFLASLLKQYTILVDLKRKMICVSPSMLKRLLTNSKLIIDKNTKKRIDGYFPNITKM